MILDPCTEVCFASSLSGEFITAIVVNSLERKLAKRTSVPWKDKASVNQLRKSLPKSKTLVYLTKITATPWSINKVIPVSSFKAAMPAKPLCHTAIHLPLGLA